MHDRIQNAHQDKDICQKQAQKWQYYIILESENGVSYLLKS